MQIEYEETIIEKIIKANADAAAQNKTIKQITLDKEETAQLAMEDDFLPVFKQNSFRLVHTRHWVQIDGIHVELTH